MWNSKLGRTLVFSLVLLSLPALAQRAFDADILADTFGYHGDVKRSVDLQDLEQGCAFRDCIPSIDNPKYVNAADAEHVADDDIVLALAWKGYHRAWPARILDQHEIVNDFVAGTAIAITWCPLCGSAVGVIREIDGQVVEFGVSGLLYNSDLVFYDRRTQTLWDQIEAKGIVGPLTGTELTLVPVTVTRWGKWKSAHPDTVVLSPDTGYVKDYSRDAYASYRQQSRLFFSVQNSSESIHPKSVVFGFDLDETMLAATESYVEKNPDVELELNGESFRLQNNADGMVTLTHKSSDTVHTAMRLYWFAWYTFHPQTELIQ